jgi:hypothetical protein
MGALRIEPRRVGTAVRVVRLAPAAVRALLVAVAAGALAPACSGPMRFVDPEADLPFYERVGVVPFTALAQDRASGLKVTDIFYTELLQKRFAEVVEPGQFYAAMTQVRGGTPAENPWSTEELARLGGQVGVQGIFLGTVRDHDLVRSGQEAFPIVSVEARLVDAATGRVVWTSSRTRRGGPGLPLVGWVFGFFGAGEVHSLDALTADVCRELLATLPRGS